MFKMKYIITQYSPIIFQEGVMHDEIKGFEDIISAGFVNLSYDNETKRFVADCYGKSISLGIKSNPIKDKFKIEKMLNGSI